MASRLTLRQLRDFVEIGANRSLSRAARHLAIAQPALSQSIAQLEQELGETLLLRHARGVDLSTVGLRLHAHAVEILADVDGLKRELRDEGGRVAGTVRLAGEGSLAPVLVAPLLRTLAKRHRDVALSVAEVMSIDIRRQVESGQAHLALMPNPSELLGLITRLPVRASLPGCGCARFVCGTTPCPCGAGSVRAG